MEVEGPSPTSRFLHTTEELVDGDEGAEVSTQLVEEEFVDKVSITCLGGNVSTSGVSETPTVEGFDLNVLSSSGNAQLALTDYVLFENEGEKDENILSVVA